MLYVILAMHEQIYITFVEADVFFTYRPCSHLGMVTATST